MILQILRLASSRDGKVSFLSHMGTSPKKEGLAEVVREVTLGGPGFGAKPFLFGFLLSFSIPHGS
jgi:hypothetical protein